LHDEGGGEPQRVIRPVATCARSNASGIIVSAIIVRIAPAATAVMAATVAADACCRVSAPSSGGTADEAPEARLEPHRHQGRLAA